MKQFSLRGCLALLLCWLVLAPVAQAGSWDPFGLFGNNAKREQLESAKERAQNARMRAEQAELEAKMAREMSERESERYERIKAKLAGNLEESDTTADASAQPADKAPAAKPIEGRKSLLVEDAGKQGKSRLWNKMSPFGWFEKDEAARQLPGKTVVKSPEQAEQAVQPVPAKEPKTKIQKAVTQASSARAAILETEKGTITIELYSQDAPVTVANFVKLAKEGFYNQSNMKFHRVVPGFVVQTGDPTGTGAGGSKERIPLEVDNKLSHEAAGYVAMARGPDPNSASSQFYITLAPQKSLDGKYAIFGKVIAGADVLPKIELNTKLYGVKLVDVTDVARDVPEKKSLFNGFFNN